MEVFLIAAVFVLLTAITLIINTWHRADEFKMQNTNSQKAVINGAAYAINTHLQNRHRHVRLFLDEYAQLITHLSNSPADENTANDIRQRLLQRFPDFFTFTITDSHGKPVMQDIDSLVGQACQTDLNNFSKIIKNNNSDLQNKVVIHPQPFQYHYDIMSPLYVNGVIENTNKALSPRVFFSSFYLNEIADILKTHEVPGQRLIIVKQADTSLIEVTREGARDKLKRDINLTKEELRSIRATKNIPHTAWQLVNLPDTTYEKAYLRKLWKEAIIIMVMVAFALFILIIVLIRTVERRAR